MVIIDESHLIPIESLQEIRFLLNTKMDSCSPLSIILCGQDELWPKLKREECKAIRQRVDMTVRLIKPLEKSDIAAYLDAHLSYAGGCREIFNAGAVKAIAKYSSGIMRVINKICTHSLLTAVDEGLKIVTEELIEKVVNSPRNENLTCLAAKPAWQRPMRAPLLPVSSKNPPLLRSLFRPRKTPGGSSK